MKPSLFVNRNIKLWLAVTASALVALTYQACSSEGFLAQRSILSTFSGTPLGLSSKSFPVCSSERKIVVTYSRNRGDKHLCFDDTALSNSATVGQVCLGGPSISTFSSRSSFAQECRSVSLCGVTPSTTEISSGQSSLTQVFELTYTGLPLGCQGSLRVEDSNQNLIQSLSFDLPFAQEDLCRRCNTGEYSCECNSTDGKNGVCGSSSGSSVPTAPTANLCLYGTPNAVTPSKDKFTWMCLGQPGGSNDTCFATNTSYVPAVCGRWQGTTTTAPPSGDWLCHTKSGVTPVKTLPDGTFLWDCLGQAGAPDVSCVAGFYKGEEKKDGACGGSNAKTFKDPPPNQLCSMGNPGEIESSADFFYWGCSGFNGGKAVSCFSYRDKSSP